MEERFNMVGKRFGRLTVLNQYKRIDRRTHWLCKCDCGVEKYIMVSSLRRGLTKSCGCLNKELLSNRHTHHMANSMEFRAWVRMRQRCNNQCDNSFKHYGARGIKVCREWNNSFEQFYKDMGKRPSNKMSLGRINNEVGYCPENCRWETRTQQIRNRRITRFITINDERKTIGEWATIYKIHRTTVYQRIRYGWDEVSALTTPVLYEKNCH